MLKITQRFTESPGAIADTLSLPYDLRKRGRFKACTENGQEVGIFIERGQVLNDGDLLLSDCGQVIQVIAQAESVITASTDDWLQFARVCYHLGNRHLPLQVGERWLRFQPDPVLQQLTELFGLTTVCEEAPFMPENGAYDAYKEQEQTQGHGHGHDHA
jgi:urease accessory protein